MLGLTGMNMWIGGIDVEVWLIAGKAQDSWGDKKRDEKLFTIESCAVGPRTTSLNTNMSFREQMESGYVLYLDADTIAKLHEDVEFRMTFPSGQQAAYGLDGSLDGLLWDLNPLSSFNLGNEVNVKFLRRIGKRQP